MQKENKMGTEKVSKLMISMGIPMILSMMLQALYNIVDSYFVSNMPDFDNISHAGEQALNALTLAFPVQMLIVALGIGTGVGVNALLAKTLGQGCREKAGKVAGNGFSLAAIIYVLFAIFGIFGTKGYILTQTKNPIIIEMADDYLSICCTLSFGMVFFSIFEKLLQSTGKSLYSTIAQVVGAVTNIILDPILIYGLFSFPAMHVRGAAYATVIGQIVSLLLGLIFHFAVNKEVPFSVRFLKPSLQIVKEIYVIGVPAIIAQAVMSVMSYAVNIIFGSVSEAYVTAYGIYYKIQQFVLFAAFGLRDAITPIISYNYGKMARDRIFDGIKFGIVYTSIIMIFSTLLLEVFAVPLSGIFSLSDETGVLCTAAIRIVSLSFLFAGFNIAFQGVFQALGEGAGTLVTSLLRQIVFVLPVAWLFSKFNPPLMWCSFIIAEALTSLIGFFILKRTIKNRIPQ